MSVSMQELLAEVYVDGRNVLVDRKRGVRSPRVLDGLKLKPVARKEGLFVLEPEQLLNILVARVELNGTIKGYQRTELDVAHARKIARAILDGDPMPVGEVAIDGNGRLYAVDCQHRIAGAIMARRPLRVVITRMDKTMQARLFTNQQKSKKLDSSNLVVSGNGPYERYVKEAIEKKDHPWNSLVSLKRSRTRMSPFQMHGLLIRYVASRPAAWGRRDHLDETWDRGLADELAPLIACFGNRQTNPPAFKATNLAAIGQTAMWVFRRHGHPGPNDHQRWLDHQAKFPFEQYLWVRSERDMVGVMLDHWNKRLRGKRRVERP